MAVSFPTSLDTFTEPSAPTSTALSSAGDGSRDHITHHTDLGNAIEALEAKVGVDSSAVTTSLDYKMARTMQLIASSVLGSSAASVSFTSIPATYESLWVVALGRSDRAVTRDPVGIRFNNDTGANYYDEQSIFLDTAVSGAGTAAATFGDTGRFTGSTAPADVPGVFEVVIPGYARTTFHKEWLAQSFDSQSNAAGGQDNVHIGGRWASTAAINRVDFIPSVGPNFITGTVFKLYGLPA